MTNKTRSILLAAVLATPMAYFAAPANAQYKVDNGAALDANNRIGSNGYNGQGRPLNINAGDAIVTGNVTAGREFRGRTTITDPRAFRGNLAGANTDRFISTSTSAYENNAQQFKQFYGASQGVAPPQGFQQVTPGSQAYTPAPPPERMSSDVRMGEIYNTDRTQFANPKFGEVMMPGPVDNSNTQSLLRASPLYGVVQDDPSVMTDNATPGFSNFRRRNVGLDDKSVQQMRDELRDGNQNLNQNQNQDPNNKTVKPGDDLNLGNKAQIGVPLESPDSPPLTGQALDSGISNAALGGQVKIEGSQRSELVPAPQQSTRYAELHNRFGKVNTATMSDQEAANVFRQERTLRDKLEKEEKDRTNKTGGISRPGSGSGRVGFPGGGSGLPSGGGGGTPGGGVAPAPKSTDTAPPDVKPDVPAAKVDPGTSAVVPAPKPADGTAPTLNNADFRPGEPIKVTSLTEGMNPGRVREMLGAAEEQLRQGKFTDAITQFDLAERVVPNNPMITIGRGHAELGASSYARAEGTLRRGLAADGNTMMGALFDLNQVLGKDRVAFLEKDLKDVVTTEPKQARAPFLLAYLKYHTGDKKMASNYLALSEQRLGKEDPLYKQLRLTWDLPKPDPLPDASK